MTTHRTTTTVQHLGYLRTIFVFFDEPVEFTCTDRTGRKGQVRGFSYQDDGASASEPIGEESYRLHFGVRPIGEEHAKSGGGKVVRPGFGWQREAKRIVLAYIDEHPDWWKTTGVDPDQAITDIASSVGAS